LEIATLGNNLDEEKKKDPLKNGALNVGAGCRKPKRENREKWLGRATCTPLKRKQESMGKKRSRLS